MTVSASSTGVGFLYAMGEVRTRASISCSMRRSFSTSSTPASDARLVRSSEMRRILPSTALRRASVGWAVKTGWNSRRLRSAVAFARPHSSTSWPYATVRSLMGSAVSVVGTSLSRLRSEETR